jgi:uncharacterized membrane protein YsdA (DUF1294 family)/cold shock CspA family protein
MANAVRRVGRISDWIDEKGYGFVVPHDGGDRAFVHIKAFQFGSRRPVVGDLISYMPEKDDRRRVNATEIRFAGQKVSQREPVPQFPRAALGVVALVAVVLCAWMAVVPGVVLVCYFVLSCLSYIAYALDKVAAQKGMWRTPETTLHLLDLLGGWPGALIAQQQYRHKTAKASFRRVFWLTALVNAAVMVWLVRSGKAHTIAAALLGA